jgi:hypothetical protein
MVGVVLHYRVFAAGIRSLGLTLAQHSLSDERAVAF